MNKRILTVQDISCVGQCSLTVALPVISACGVETAVLPSSVLSTHTGGFSGYTFRDLTEDMPAIERHWVKEGLKFDAVYSGYVSASQIDPILHIWESCLCEGGLRIVDPAMADNGRLYAGFGEDHPRRMTRLCRGADHLLPNLTEAAMLLGREPILSGYDEGYIRELSLGLLELGAKNVVITGVSFEPSHLGCAVTASGGETEYYFNDRLGRMAHGTGDLFASVYVGGLMNGLSPMDSAALAADTVCDAIEATPPEHTYGVCFEQVLYGLGRRFFG